MSLEACPCGSGLAFDVCCGPLLRGEAQAPTAEKLMRSRFTAFVRGANDYLLATWHPDTRPDAEKLGGTGLEWIHLRIDATEAGGEQDEQGIVVFTATFRDKGRVRQLHERSRFAREAGRWLYVDGDCRVDEPGRNDPCYCGSGVKFKRCCGARKA
jgi:SEC-C motif-containing protein